MKGIHINNVSDLYSRETFNKVRFENYCYYNDKDEQVFFDKKTNKFVYQYSNKVIKLDCFNTGINNLNNF